MTDFNPSFGANTAQSLARDPKAPWYWHMLPKHIAAAQHGWERGFRIKGWHATGLSLKDIAAKEGISSTMASIYLRRKRHRTIAPILTWFEETSDLERLAKLERLSRIKKRLAG